MGRSVWGLEVGLEVKKWVFGDALVGMGVGVVGVWRVELERLIPNIYY
jgi:hypothetical protein